MTLQCLPEQRTWALHLLQLLFQLTPLYFEEPFMVGDWMSPDDFLRGLPLLSADPSAHTRTIHVDWLPFTYNQDCNPLSSMWRC